MTPRQTVAERVKTRAGLDTLLNELMIFLDAECSGTPFFGRRVKTMRDYQMASHPVARAGMKGTVTHVRITDTFSGPTEHFVIELDNNNGTTWVPTHFCELID